MSDIDSLIEQLPDFIDRDILPLKLSVGQIEKEFRVGDISVRTYITNRKNANSPLPSKTVKINKGKGFMHTYLVLDVLRYAIEDGFEIKSSSIKKSKALTIELTREQINLKNEIRELRKIRSELLQGNKFMLGDLSDISPSIHHDSFNLVPQSEIIQRAKSYGDACGVYFLISSDEIIYIGQSVNIASRISGHRDKDFDSVAFVTCKKQELDILESLYIIAYRPKLNGYAGGNGSKRLCTPMTLRSIIEQCKR